MHTGDMTAQLSGMRTQKNLSDPTASCTVYSGCTGLAQRQVFCTACAVSTAAQPSLIHSDGTAQSTALLPTLSLIAPSHKAAVWHPPAFRNP
jgi:hypothetical protein